MKVVITGATGNVGTSTIETLVRDPQVDSIVGIARRRPGWEPAKTEWIERDILAPGLVGVFEGADAVIHLAWAIQPSRDMTQLQRVNVEGSRQVFEAVANAGVGRLVVASSVGAYSKGPKDKQVDESWPTEGTQSSFYSRHKVAVERMLDRFEHEHPDTAVVRLRPALIFKDDAATEIRRLFIGPFLPNLILRQQLLLAVPRISGLRFQVVHSHDVGEAYRLAVVKDVSGPFNLASSPPLSPESIARALGKRSFPVPTGVVRTAASLSWKLHLQPTPPGWLDMAQNVPMMSSERARAELGWEPQHGSMETLEELVSGIREGHGTRTPPLTPDSGKGRAGEVRSGVGSRTFGTSREEQMVKYLTDAHSIELQAREQMKRAPEIAGDGSLKEAFEEHLVETDDHERKVSDRLKQLGRDTSTLKDLAGSAGAWPMVAFAASQPDSTGKLVAHAYSYEHMELAAYELLRRLAERSGDEATARMAMGIAAQEKRMGERLEENFGAAVDAALAESGDDPAAAINGYLRDVHAIEGQAIMLLESASEVVEEPQLREDLAVHLEESREHSRRVKELLRERGGRPSTAKDAGLRAGGLNVSGFFAAQPDATTKIAGFAYAFEHLEIASYEMLRLLAERAGDAGVATAASEILAEERDAAAKVAASWDRPETPLGSSS